MVALLVLCLGKSSNLRLFPASNQIMSEKVKGRGRLVPAQATGVEYKVEFGIDIVPETSQYGRGLKPTRWAKCSVRSAHAQRFPDGTYFLHADDGRVHQLKAIGGKWHCLALAA